MKETKQKVIQARCKHCQAIVSVRAGVIAKHRKPMTKLPCSNSGATASLHAEPWQRDEGNELKRLAGTAILDAIHTTHSNLSKGKSEIL